MPEKIEIPVKELNSLRRLLIEASETIHSLVVGGLTEAPNLTEEQKRQLRYEHLIETGARGTKPEHLKKKNKMKNPETETSGPYKSNSTTIAKRQNYEKSN